MADIEILDPEDKGRLEYTLGVRKTIIGKLIGDGEIPGNTADKILLVAALDGMDRTVLARTKIKSDERTAQGQQQSAKMVAELLLSVNNKTSGPRVEPLAEVDYIVDDLVKGETDIGDQTLNYETFLKQQESK